MHREALKLLQQLVEESKSDHVLGQKFRPEMIIEYLKVKNGNCLDYLFSS